MEREIMKKKLGLPPLPSITGGPAQKRTFKRKRDYTPVTWDNYFTLKHDVPTENGDVFRVYECGTEGPVLLFLHGGGFSALSWSLLSAHVITLVKCRCVAIDLRGHGDSVTADTEDLSAERMSSDVGNVVASLFNDDQPPIILVGHSMGGAIAVHTAARQLIPHLIGIAVIDVVEGTAMDALSSMQSFLRGRPQVFKSMDTAIEWVVRSGQIHNLESAKVSMVGQLKCVESDETGSEELEHCPSQTGVSMHDAINEEDEGVSSGNSPSQASSQTSDLSSPSFTKPSNPGESHKYTWRIDLSRTEKFWKGWFEGLSQKFLSCAPPKMLILAGPDRLDRDLTIGQMQGKFQMNLLPQCGHAVHEDVPDKVADILANFMLRHRVTEPVGPFERLHAPGLEG